MQGYWYNGAQSGGGGQLIPLIPTYPLTRVAAKYREIYYEADDESYWQMIPDGAAKPPHYIRSDIYKVSDLGVTDKDRWHISITTQLRYFNLQHGDSYVSEDIADISGIPAIQPRWYWPGIKDVKTGPQIKSEGLPYVSLRWGCIYVGFTVGISRDYTEDSDGVHLSNWFVPTNSSYNKWTAPILKDLWPNIEAKLNEMLDNITYVELHITGGGAVVTKFNRHYMAHPGKGGLPSDNPPINPWDGRISVLPWTSTDPGAPTVMTIMFPPTGNNFSIGYNGANTHTIYVPDVTDIRPQKLHLPNIETVFTLQSGYATRPWGGVMSPEISQSNFGSPALKRSELALANGAVLSLGHNEVWHTDEMAELGIDIMHTGTLIPIYGGYVDE